MQAVFSLKTFIIFLQSYQLFWNLLPWLRQDSLQCKEKHKLSLRVMLTSLYAPFTTIAFKRELIFFLKKENKTIVWISAISSLFLAYAPARKARSVLTQINTFWESPASPLGTLPCRTPNRTFPQAMSYWQSQTLEMQHWDSWEFMFFMPTMLCKAGKKEETWF